MKISRRSVLAASADIQAENDFGKTLVSTRQSGASASGRTLTHSFPAHSYTQLRATLA